MELQLTYAGKLLSTGGKSRPKHVHQVRKKFHPQLRHFWYSSPLMTISGEEYRDKRIRSLTNKHRLKCYEFVPLVDDSPEYLCSVDILLLRPPRQDKLRHTIFSDGDIDGQLNTLFDALSKPSDENQLKSIGKPDEDEIPFFCLVADDSLITKVSVSTGLMLEHVEGIDAKNAARALITVQVSWPAGQLGYARWA